MNYSKLGLENIFFKASFDSERTRKSLRRGRQGLLCVRAYLIKTEIKQF
jgi:hypothetical protein